MNTRLDLEARSPIPGESLNGYLADITSDNSLYRVQHITSLSGATQAHRPNVSTMHWQGLPALADQLQIDVEELRLRSYPADHEDPIRRAFFGTTVHSLDLRIRERFFAPSALLASAHHKAIWQLRLPYDAETGERLVSKCPKSWCGKTQRWRHSAGTRYCDSCASDLALQEVARLDEETLRGYARAIGLTHTDPLKRTASCAMLPEEIARLGPAIAFELLLRLVPVANPACTWRSATRLWHNDASELAKGIAKAWHLLRKWPDAIVELIDETIAKSARRHGDGNGGATMRFLRNRKSDFVSEPIRELIGSLRDRLDLDGPKGPELRERTMTCKEAAQSLGRGTKEIVELRRAGGLKTLGMVRGDLLVPVFDRSEVSQVKANIVRRFALNRCGEKLGLPYYAIEQLAALGHLPLLSHPYFRLRYCCPQTSVEDYAAFVCRVVDKRPSEIDDGQPISEVMQFVGARLKPWDAIIEAMLAGQLDYAIVDGTRPLFKRIRVRRSDALPFLRMEIARNSSQSPLMAKIDPAFAFTDKISKRDAAEVLNLSVLQGTNFLRNYPRTAELSIPLANIIRDSQMYVSNAELAAKWDASCRMVRAAAESVGISQSGGAGYDRSNEAKLIQAIKAV